MCSPRPKILNGTSETDSEQKDSKELDFLNPWVDRAPEPAFFPTNHRFHTFKKFQDHCFRVFVARNVMCLSCSAQATDPALSSILALHTILVLEIVPENVMLRNPAGFQ